MNKLNNFIWLFFIVFVFLLFILVIHGIYENDDEFDKNQLIDQFDEIEFSLNGGHGLSNYSNDNGILAWSESYLLMAYLEMYEATKDMKYLNKFIFQAKEVANYTDKLRGIKDHYGESLVGWSSTKYSRDNVRLVVPMNSAMLVYPFVKFALLVKENTELDAFRKDALYLQDVAVQAIGEFDMDWRYDVNTGEGTYEIVDDVLGGGWDYTFKIKKENPDWIRYPPFNSDAAFGRVLVILWQLTGNEEYSLKSKALATHLRNGLNLSSSMYLWNYYPSKAKYYNPNIEDISHGAIDVSFVVEAYKFGIVFQENDLLYFSNTLLNARDKIGFSKFVDGTGDDSLLGNLMWSNFSKRPYSDAVGRWLDLSLVDCGVYDAVRSYLLYRINNYHVNDPQVLLGLSKLIKYYDVCGYEET